MSVVGRIPLHVIFKIVVALNLPQTLIMLICICLFIADSMVWVCHVVSMHIWALRQTSRRNASWSKVTRPVLRRQLRLLRHGLCLLQEVENVCCSPRCRCNPPNSKAIYACLEDCLLCEWQFWCTIAPPPRPSQCLGNCTIAPSPFAMGDGALSPMSPRLHVHRLQPLQQQLDLLDPGP